ncbi:MAG: YggS family pyridoxal phosphate-dependent enzyme [Candidatus Omnitrophota bacterium]|nr:YggS family pyridoxal phosphate-dependent enzyme [Candidatus Omnitrophota bacterium]
MLKDNILKIQKKLSEKCIQLQRSSEGITLVAVSKNRTIDEIKEAVACGIHNIGENRVQEALLKYKELSTVDSRQSALKWHMVGHLQRNKVRDAVKIFDLIHSVDSLKLAQEINKESCRIGKIQEILIEVNTSGEPGKFGIKPQELSELLKEVGGFNNIKVSGLMTIAPLVDDPQKVRPYFRALKELRDKINSLSLITYPLTLLSMGMSNDFEVAIEEGADMVRIGQAIFERQN